MNNLTPRARSIIYIAALLILIGLAIAGILAKAEALEYIAYIAGALGLSTAVQYRPTITHSERDETAALRAAAEAAVTLHRAEAPEAEQAAALDRLGALILR